LSVFLEELQKEKWEKEFWCTEPSSFELNSKLVKQQQPFQTVVLPELIAYFLPYS
jgi:hypothetical protein